MRPSVLHRSWIRLTVHCRCECECEWYLYMFVHTCVQKDRHIPPSSNWCCRASVKTPLVAPVSRWRGADVFHINPLYHSFFYAIIHSSSCFISVTWSFWIFLFHFKTELCHSPVWRIWCHAQKSINPSPRHHKLQSSSANGGRRRPCLRERFGFYGPSRLTALRQWDHINSTLSAAAVCLNNTVWTVLEMTLWMWVTRYKTKVSEPYFPQQMRLWGAAAVRGNCCPHDIYPQRELKYDHPWCVCWGGFCSVNWTMSENVSLVCLELSWKKELWWCHQRFW